MEQSRKATEAEAVATLRMHCVDKILTLHCPRCDQAFVDFVGCFALTCSRCGCSFCAWCLDMAPDSRACHLHVAACPSRAADAPDDYHGTDAQFRQAQAGRITRMLRTYLAAQQARLREPLLSALARDLADVGVNAADLTIAR